jgi:uncharacterized LabA/DUF88 family protein
MMAKTAILVDGSFYQKRAQALLGKKSASDRAHELIEYCHKHLIDETGPYTDELYRIFYYDCPPMSKKILHPQSGELKDFSESPVNHWHKNFTKELMHERKLARREGIDFIIDSMLNHINDDLLEHTDGQITKSERSETR